MNSTGGAEARSVPQIGIGEVRHARRRPLANRFAYPTYFLMLPMRSLREQAVAALNRNRFGLVAFHDADHGDGGGDSLAWVEALLAREGVVDADGEVWLHCYPRVLGYVFNPVSFWHCHRGDGSLAAIVVEVNNTFGDRHSYLLAGAQLGYGRELRASKAMHVSPFCAVEGGYRFRFMRTASRCVARIDYFDAASADEPLLQTSVSGRLEPLNPVSVRRAFFGMPLMTLAVIARIHWQALRLWIKRVPLHARPAARAELLSRTQP